MTLSEPRWPSAVAVLAVAALAVSAGGGARFGVAALELGLLVLLTLAAPHRRVEESGLRRRAALGLTAVVSAANLLSLALLVRYVVHGSVDGPELLLTAAQVWWTNVIVFGLWYWELDGGGPPARLADLSAIRDFAFPQMTDPLLAEPGWHTRFVDYLYLSFTNASGFSPADALPLTRWAKLLMMLESSISLVTLVLVAARAVNMLG